MSRAKYTEFSSSAQPIWARQSIPYSCTFNLRVSFPIPSQVIEDNDNFKNQENNKEEKNKNKNITILTTVEKKGKEKTTTINKD